MQIVSKLLAPSWVQVKRTKHDLVIWFSSICILPTVLQLRPSFFSLYRSLHGRCAAPRQDTLSTFWGFSNSCVSFPRRLSVAPGDGDALLHGNG